MKRVNCYNCHAEVIELISFMQDGHCFCCLECILVFQQSYVPQPEESKIIQKFRKYQFVRVHKIRGGYYSIHGGHDAIINATYSELFGGKDVGTYDIYKLMDGKVVDHSAWYDERQLELLPDQDIEKAALLMEDFNFGR